MKKQTWQVYKLIAESKDFDGYFDIHFEGSKSACEKFYKSHGGANKNYHLGYDITDESLNWFDSSGWLVKEIPEECVNDCSTSGDVSDSVKSWVFKLEFSLPSLKQAREYLQEFGAWDDLERSGSFKLAERVLCCACCDIKENGEWLGLIH